MKHRTNILALWNLLLLASIGAAQTTQPWANVGVDGLLRRNYIAGPQPVAGAKDLNWDFGDGGSTTRWVDWSIGAPTAKPAGAISLFDGTPSSLDTWTYRDGKRAEWTVANGEMTSQHMDIITKAKFKDFLLHVEWNEPLLPAEVKGQARGNSGVYLQGESDKPGPIMLQYHYNGIRFRNVWIVRASAN